MKPNLKLTMITGGVMTLCGPLVGVLGTVLGMRSGFETLGQSGVTETEELSSSIGATLVSTAGGIAIGILGFVILIVSLIVWLCSRERDPAG